MLKLAGVMILRHCYLAFRIVTKQGVYAGRVEVRETHHSRTPLGRCVDGLTREVAMTRRERGRVGGGDRSGTEKEWS